MPISATKHQRLIKLGHSLAITIDKTFYHKAGWDDTKSVVVRYDAERSLIMLRQPHLDRALLPDTQEVPEMPEEFPEYQPTHAFELWLFDFLRTHRGFLRKLVREKIDPLTEALDEPV